jgi:hypothetical protein
MQTSICLLIVIFFVQPAKGQPPAVWVTDSRIKEIAAAIGQRSEPQYTAFEQLQGFVNRHKDRSAQVPEIWYVPGYYRDAEGHVRAKEGLQDDANIAYGFALYSRLTGEQGWAKKSRDLIRAWVDGVQKMNTEDDSQLSFSYHFPAFILAADLLRESDAWTPEDEAAFSRFLRQKALPMNTMDRKNNWGNWGLVLVSAIAAYLDDQVLLDSAAVRWTEFIDTQVDSGGVLSHEVHRSEGQRGVWYSHFSLMPQTIAAEILCVNGRDLFDYTSPSGESLESAFHRVAEWSRYPDRFPFWKGDASEVLGTTYFSYFEILNARWRNVHAEHLLKKNRPLSARHSAPFLTLTHGERFE